MPQRGLWCLVGSSRGSSKRTRLRNERGRVPARDLGCEPVTELARDQPRGNGRIPRLCCRSWVGDHETWWQVEPGRRLSAIGSESQPFLEELRLNAKHSTLKSSRGSFLPGGRRDSARRTWEPEGSTTGPVPTVRAGREPGTRLQRRRGSTVGPGIESTRTWGGGRRTAAGGALESAPFLVVFCLGAEKNNKL
jgi:hypothetical protein